VTYGLALIEVGRKHLQAFAAAVRGSHCEFRERLEPAFAFVSGANLG
jgi:hypothetical protein